MIIQGADRFGLAQLHQLRGRVGRGPAQSYLSSCVYATRRSRATTWPSPRPARSTLRDHATASSWPRRTFELRREGELLGLRQSGLPPLRVADLRKPDHRALAGEARAHAEALVDDAGPPARPALDGLEARADARLAGAGRRRRCPAAADELDG